MRGRIRSIKPEVLTDELLWDAEVRSGHPLYRLFTGLWMYADREGRFEWRPRALKALILPYWDGDMEGALHALYESGFVLRYEVDGRTYGACRTFLKHQTPNHKEPDSIIPPPPKTTRPGQARESPGKPGKECDASLPSQDLVPGRPVSSGNGLGTERIGNGTEGNGGAGEATPPVPDGTPLVPEPLELLPHEPIPEPAPAKPRDEAKLLWLATLKAEAKAMGIPRPEIGGKVRDAVIRMAREHAESTGESFPSALRAWVIGGLQVHRDSGKPAQWAVKDWRPYAARAPARPGRLAPAPATTGKDFENEPDIEEQMRRQMERWNDDE